MFGCHFLSGAFLQGQYIPYELENQAKVEIHFLLLADLLSIIRYDGERMAVIQKDIELVGSKGRVRSVALFDSGASYSCISPDLAKKLEQITPLPEPMNFGTAKNGEQVTATERTSLNFYLQGYRFSDEFMLISDLSEPIIIGAATLQKWRMKLDFENDEVIIDPKVTKLRLM